MRKILLILLAVLVLAGLPAYLWRAELAVAVAQRVARQHLGSQPLAELPDGLHVGLCGAGSPFPDELRAGPCTLVIAGRQMLVFDAGNGASRNIGKMGFSQGDIQALFLTHFHSDHIDGLGELLLQRWVQGGHTAPLPVYGPEGVQAVVEGLRGTYSQDQHYRVEHHGAEVVAPGGFGGQAQAFSLDASGRMVVMKTPDLQVTAFAVNHGPVHPSVGYRIDYKGRSVVLSGDTIESPAVVREAKGADLLLHEALSPRLVNALSQVAADSDKPRLAKIFHDILNYHATPEEAARSAQTAGVRALVLNHIVPTLPPLPGMEKAFLGEAASLYSGPLKVGRDGDFISMPAGGPEIQQGRRF